METGTVLGGLSLAVAALTAWNSLRNTNISDRSGTNAQLQALNKTYREEIDRLELKMDESETQCLARVAQMQQQLDAAQRTIVMQANRISSLERTTREGS